MGLHKACIIGLGYIGLPTATLLAKQGVNVLGVDVFPDIVNAVNAGVLPKVEPGLEEILKEVIDAGHLRASLQPEDADVYVITVPTPFKEGHEPDLSYIQAAAKSIAPYLRPGQLIILESTSPVGTTELLSGWLSDLRPDLTFSDRAGEEADIQLAYCPERVLPGKIVKELVENDRIIGGLTNRSAEMATNFYKIFVHGNLLKTDARTAEMCKLAENSFRDVNIAFANELSIICDKLGINVWELISLANRHPRVDILKPGCGVGGHCISVDPWFIVHDMHDETRLIQTARMVNDKKPEWLIRKIEQTAREFLKNNVTPADITIACLGLAFKPDIDDLRESPAIEIALALAAKGFKVLAVEPNIQKLPKNLAKAGIKLVDLDEALKRANIFALNVAHKQFISRMNDFKGKTVINSVTDN